MIDPNTETLLSLTEAAKLIPVRRGGRRCAISTAYRWTVSGCKGIILESLQVGGTRCTSREALGRFFEGLTYGPGDHRPVRSPARRRRAAERAARELERQGV